jgi:multidrug resistance efflux pump
MMKKPLLILLLAALTVGTWYYYQINFNHTYDYSGTIEAEDVHVGSKIGGRVVAVHVQEGETVQAGDLLIEFDKDASEEKLDQAQSELEYAHQRYLELKNGSRPQEITQTQARLEQAQSNLRLLQNGARQEDIRAAQKNMEAAKAELELANITLKRMRDLFSTNDTSRDNLDQSVTRQQVSQNKLEATQAELDRLLAGFRAEEIDAARALVKEASSAYELALCGAREEQIAQAQSLWKKAQSAVREIEIELDEKTIRAPEESTVETSRLHPGDLIPPNQPVMTLLLFDPLWIRIYVPESLLSQVALHREVRLKVQSLPKQTFTATVVQINRNAEYTPRNVQTPETRDDLVYGVKLEIHDPRHVLHPGMVADIDLHPPETTQEHNQ